MLICSLFAVKHSHRLFQVGIEPDGLAATRLQVIGASAIPHRGRPPKQRLDGDVVQFPATPHNVYLVSSAGPQSADRSILPSLRQGGEQVDQETIGHIADMRLEQHLDDAGRASEVAVDLEGRVAVEQIRQRRSLQQFDEMQMRLFGVLEAGEKVDRPGATPACAGYDTYMTGKWHVKFSAGKVFDYTGSVRGGMPKQTAEGYNRPEDEQDYEEGWKPWDKQYGGFWKGGKHWSEVLGDEGVQFIGDSRDRDNPFFMYLAFNAPHDPRQSPKEFVDRYPLSDIEVPENFLPEYPYNSDIGNPRRLRDERLAPFPRTEYSVKVNRQEYYAIITHMDEQIGRILKALDESGERDNTYILFCGDHGLAVGQHGFMGKQNMYEHSIKAPLLVSGPGLPRGQRIDAPVYIQDLMPTSLELAGIAVPPVVEYKSLLPLINGEREKSYEAIYGAYRNVQRMVRKDDYKLIYYTKIDKTRLYNLREDPNEINDLAGDPQYAPVIKDLFKQLMKLQQETGDQLKLEPACLA